MKMRIIKQHAAWLPRRAIFYKQIIVSIWSYITLPFFRKKENGIQEFFKKNYYVEPDGLVFDGKNSRYYDKAKDLLHDTKELTVIDLGCGDSGEFYWWLIHNDFSIYSYIGVDFSVRGKEISKEASIINDNVKNLGRYLNSKSLIVLSNTLCYLSDNDFCELLNMLRPEDEILIFEPEPNLFWDAHFNGIRPIYRTHEYVKDFLEKKNIVVNAISIDYLLYKHIRISYCIYGKKEAAQ